MSELIDQSEAPNHAHASSVTEQTFPSEEPSHQQTLHVSELDHAVDDIPSETLVGGSDEPVSSDVEPVEDQLLGSEDVSDVEAPEDNTERPPRKHGRGR